MRKEIGEVIVAIPAAMLLDGFPGSDILVRIDLTGKVREGVL
jgi:hypothetical protein